jgi:hypothetical protein
MSVDGSTITDTQVGAVSDYETGQAATFNSVAETAQAEADAATIDAAGANGWVNVCLAALGGNPKDRSKAASRYNELVDGGVITPVA